MGAELNIGGDASGASKALGDVKSQLKGVGSESDSASAKAKILAGSFENIGEEVEENAAEIEAAEAAMEAMIDAGYRAAEALKGVNVEAHKASEAVASVADASKAMGGALDQATETSELEHMRAEVYALQRALRSVEDQAERTGGSKSSGWTQLFTGVTAGIQVVEKLGQGIQKARHFIKQMADSGNADFQQLNASVESITVAFDELILRLTTSSGAGGFFKSITDEASLAVSSVGHLSTGLDKTIDSFRSWIADTTGSESLKKWADGLKESTDGIAEASEKALEAEKQRQQLAKGDKVIADFEAARAKDAAQEAVNEIKSLEEIDAKIQEQIESTKELAKRQGLSDKAAQEAREKLLQLDTRRKAVVKELADAEKQASDDLIAEMGEWADKRLKIHEDALAKELRATEQFDAMLTAARENAAIERQKRIDGIAGGAGVKGAEADINAAAGSEQALIKRLASNAGEEGSDEYRKAHRAAVSQSQGGRAAFSPEQIAEAQAQNANAITQSLQGSGQVGADVVDALKQNLQAAQQLDQNNAQVSQEVATIRKELDALMGGARARAQKTGAKRP